MISMGCFKQKLPALCTHGSLNSCFYATVLGFIPIKYSASPYSSKW